MQYSSSGAEQAGGSIMCNLATISAGRKGHQVSGGLSLIFHSASSPNDNSKSMPGLLSYSFHSHDGGHLGTSGTLKL